MLVPGVEESLLERVVDRIAQVDAHNFRAERGRELPHGEDGGLLVQGGGGRFHKFFSGRRFLAGRARLHAFAGRSILPIRNRSNASAPIACVPAAILMKR